MRALAVVVFTLLLIPVRGSAQTLDDPELLLEPVASGLSSPTTMGFVAPDDFLVLQKDDGNVRRVLAGDLQPGSVLDVPVANDSEQGLLGIAVNSESPPRVFLFYTESATDGGAPIANRVYRYTWNAAAAQLQSPQLVLDLPVTPGPNHDGGIILLGPPNPSIPIGDGAPLYVVIGDLNRDNQLENFPSGAPPDDTAVILRVAQDGTAYPGNPFTPYCSVTTTQTCPGGGGCPGGEACVTEVARYFAYGIRNSFGMALDPATGALWDTENGPSSDDEVNRVPSGFNSGWQQIMGRDIDDPQDPGDLFDMPGVGSTYSDPEFTWIDTNAPTSIVFPVGSLLGSNYDQMALVGDNNSGQLFRFPLNGSRTAFQFTEPELQDLVANNNAERDLLAIGSGFGAITDLKIGPDAALYVVSIGNGAVYRITGPRAVPVAPLAALVLLALVLAALARTGP